MSRPLFRLVSIPVLAAALAVALPATAGAHVRVSADSTATGSYAALTFRVPNESDDAGTVKVAVTLPQDKPFLYVGTKPLAGWTAVTTEAALPTPVDVSGTTITKAVRTVTWTADKGTQVAPGQYEEFAIVAGPLPAPGTMLLPATQTYSDGKVVTWDQATPASGEEPEYPAPEIKIVAATGDGHGGASAEPTAETSPTVAPAAAVATSDPLARGLGAGGLALGLAALVLAARSAGRRSA